jgi:hypothetical protein
MVSMVNCSLTFDWLAAVVDFQDCNVRRGVNTLAETSATAHQVAPLGKSDIIQHHVFDVKEMACNVHRNNQKMKRATILRGTCGDL